MALYFVEVNSRCWFKKYRNNPFSIKKKWKIKLKSLMVLYHNTVIFLSFGTDRSRQTVQTQFKLLLEEQSDQGLHCLLFRLHRLDSLLYSRAT